MSQEQHVQLGLVVSKQHRGPQLFPRLALQQAIWVFDLKPHPSEQPCDPLERARSGPLSKSAIAHNVQAGGCDCAVGCADDQGGEGGGTAGVEVDVLVLEQAGKDVEGLREQEDSDRRAEEDVGEDGGEGHDVGAAAVVLLD